MLRMIISFFLTLVLMVPFSNASPAPDPSPIQQEKIESDNTKAHEPPNLDEENISITFTKERPSPQKVEYHYPYRQSISPRLSLLIDLKNLNNEGDYLFYGLGFSYLFPRFRSPQLEMGADLISNSRGIISGVKRWIFNERTSFRPFLSTGIALKVVGNEGLATATNKDNYMLKASAGIEDLLKTPMSIRLELELLAGLKNLYTVITFGYSWGW